MASPNNQPAASAQRCEGIEFGTGDVGILVELLLQHIDLPRQVAAQPLLLGVIARYIGAPDIGLPLTAHRSEVEKHRIVIERGRCACASAVSPRTRSRRACGYPDRRLFR